MIRVLELLMKSVKPLRNV